MTLKAAFFILEHGSSEGEDKYLEAVKTIKEKCISVVRCKNCIHYDLGVCLKIYSDGNAHFEAWQSRNPDDFCSYGERKVVDDES